MPDILQWSASGPAGPSRGPPPFPGIAPAMNRSMTMPTPITSYGGYYDGQISSATVAVLLPPYGDQYNTPTQFGGQASAYAGPTQYLDLNSNPQGMYTIRSLPPISSDGNAWYSGDYPNSNGTRPATPEEGILCVCYIRHFNDRKFL
jgi:hypothetical protein